MQKFTRSLTREIEVAGERLAVTFSTEGLSVPPVGSRKEPATLSWAACLSAVVNAAKEDSEPSNDQVAEALAWFKGDRKHPAKASSEPTEACPDAAKASSEPAKASPEPAATATNSPPAAGTAPSSQATSSESNNDLPALLGRIDRWLAQHRPRFAKALLPGASEDQLEKLQREAGVPVPKELQTLLRWHNGQDPEVFGAFEQSFFLMSTDQILEVKKDLDAHAPAGWQKSWLPFLDDDRDNYVCIDSAHPGAPVHEVWRGRSESPVTAPSLTAWVKNYVEGLEKGAYTEDSERGTFSRA